MITLTIDEETLAKALAPYLAEALKPTLAGQLLAHIGPVQVSSGGVGGMSTDSIGIPTPPTNDEIGVPTPEANDPGIFASTPDETGHDDGQTAPAAEAETPAAEPSEPETDPVTSDEPAEATAPASETTPAEGTETPAPIALDDNASTATE